MGKFSGFKCSLCGHEYGPDDVIYTCPADGGNLDVILDYSRLKQELDPRDFIDSRRGSMWRYLPLLPVESAGGEGTPLQAAGWTPVFKTSRLAHHIGLKRLWIKDESRNPTASFKDRASALVVRRAQEIGSEIVVTASTGNAGAALAGMAAAVGQKAVIFAPKDAPTAKIAQLLVYGAQVLLVDGTYDDAFDLSVEASTEFGWYCRNTGYNPFTAEGKKTAALEIWEWHQDSDFDFDLSTLNLFVSVGDGNIISGLHKAFKDLVALGWIDKPPRIFGVQAEGSAAIANAFLNGNERIIPVSSDTMADSISVDLPRDGVRAVRAARQTGGSYILVSDNQILEAIAALGVVGVFAEPAGAAAFAGVRKALNDGKIAPDEPILALNTGNGLKDVKAAMGAVQPAVIIEPSLDAVKRVIE